MTMKHAASRSFPAWCAGRHVACIFGVRPKPIIDRVAQALGA